MTEVVTRDCIRLLPPKLLIRAMSDLETRCLRWTGAHDGSGYGAVWVPEVKKVQRVHVVAFESAIGPVPAGLHLDHVWDWGCRHRDCFAPWHLEAVTQAENNRRYKLRITHCPQGHPYDKQNTYVRKDNGGRGCRICRNEAAAASHARQGVAA